MSTSGSDDELRRMAAESLAGNDPTGWFERLYVAADHGSAAVPWDCATPQELLVGWARRKGLDGQRLDGQGRRAVVVGCGYGRDAEFVATLGFATTAFDVAPSAIEAARRRYPDSQVDYVVADLLDLPPAWDAGFDLVVESITVQAMPRSARDDAIGGVRRLVGPGGLLVVIAAARAADEVDDGPPWPLTRAEVEAFAGDGLVVARIEDLRTDGPPSSRRWRAEFTRPVEGRAS